MATLLRLTLRPDGAPPVEAWAFEVAGTGQGGWFAGSLPQGGSLRVVAGLGGGQDAKGGD